MDELPPAARVVIIGGGVMGASTAYHLAARGCTDVVLLEKQSFFGQGATGKCAGGIRYQFATEVNIRLSQHSLPMLDALEETTGQPAGVRKCGYLFLLTREEDLAAFRRNVELQHRLGVATEWLTPDEIPQRARLVETGDVLAATFHPEEGLADPNSVVMGYIGAARRLGARLLTDVAVTGVRVEGGRARAVQTRQGEIACDVVVNAAGPWSAAVGAMAGVEVPVTPVRRQMLTTNPLPEVPGDFPFTIDFARSLYFHIEGGGLLVGMSNPDEPPGFDESVDEEWEFATLEAAVERMPLLERASRAAHWAGLYEVTPDAHPVIGATPVEGYYVITGFSGHGFMHGPIAGLLLAEEILDGRATTVDIHSLRLARFAEGDLIREYNVI